MLPYFITLLYEGFPVIFLTSVLASFSFTKANKIFSGWYFLLLSLIGWGIYKPLVQGQIILETRLVLTITALILFVVVLLTSFSLFKKHRLMGKITTIFQMVFCGVLLLKAVFSYSRFLYIQELSAISVLNSEILINSFATLLGIMFLIGLYLINRLLLNAARSSWIRFFFLGFGVVQSIFWAADIIFILMRMEILDLYDQLLNFVAQAGEYSTIYNDSQIAWLGFVIIYYLLSEKKRFRSLNTNFQDVISVRFRKKKGNLIKRLTTVSVLLLVCFTGSGFYFNTLYSSSIVLSPAKELKPINDKIEISIDDVKDGNLHRYAYISYDGHYIRFFLINRFSDSVKIGVVFDSCMLCGDAGYTQVGEDILCTACGVKIFKPSIGKQGGCNPIPLKHKLENNRIIIQRKDLEAGTRYFDEIVKVVVYDPISKKELVNLDAPFSYQYGLKTYYFEKEENRDLFRDDPVSYIEKMNKGVRQ